MYRRFESWVVSDTDSPAVEVDVPVPAAVADDDRWELLETSTSEFGDERLVSVTGTQALYGDRALRERFQAVTGAETLVRSFFVGKLTTSPPLTPGIADLVVRSVAAPRAKARFTDDLDSRGFEGIRERGDSRLSVDADTRARVAEFEAAVPVDGDRLRMGALLAIWDRDTYMLTAGGIYPLAPVAGAEEVLDAPESYRRELVDLVRAVG